MCWYVCHLHQWQLSPTYTSGLGASGSSAISYIILYTLVFPEAWRDTFFSCFYIHSSFNIEFVWRCLRVGHRTRIRKTISAILHYHHSIFGFLYWCRVFPGFFHFYTLKSMCKFGFKDINGLWKYKATQNSCKLVAKWANSCPSVLRFASQSTC